MKGTPTSTSGTSSNSNSPLSGSAASNVSAVFSRFAARFEIKKPDFDFVKKTSEILPTPSSGASFSNPDSKDKRRSSFMGKIERVHYLPVCTYNTCN